jgi:HK97 family phage major capsid protein
MTKLELLDKRKQLRAANKALFDTAKKESRQLSADEQQKVQTNLDELDIVNNELDELEIRGAGNQRITFSAPKEVRMNIGRILFSAIDNTTLTSEERAFVEEGRNRFAAAGVKANGNIQIPISYRALVDSTAATGTEEQYIFDIATPLREQSALTRLGATFIFDSGLIGIPSYKGTNFGWLGLNEDAADVGKGFENKILANKRIAGIIPIAKDVLISSNHDVQGIIESSL